MTKIHVVCHRPGLIRGGRPNPAHASYDPGEHTPAQLRELVAEPAVRVVIGHALTEAHIVAMEHEAKGNAEAAEAEKAKGTETKTKKA